MNKFNETRISRGFTLLELLIVIAIIAILAAFLIWVLNPAETLRKGRDSQRMSDLKTLNQALAFYITVVSNPVLDDPNARSPFGNDCEDTSSGNIWFSAPDPCGSCEYSYSITVPEHPDSLGAWETYFLPIRYTLIMPDASNPGIEYKVGQGWIPVDFNQITGGSPIARLPVDPINKYWQKNDGSYRIGSHTTDSIPAVGEGYYYRYTCKKNSTPGGWVCGPSTWEIDANLESEDGKEKEKNDGGDWKWLYETGTCLQLLPKDKGI